MISISQLKVSFPGKEVLKQIEISFEDGKAHGIIGLNGAGKTTFFNTLAGYIKADSGSIMNDDQPLRSREVAYLETSNYFYPGLTGNDYLKIFNTTNENFSLDKFQELMQLPLDELTGNYSTGMKKKLALLAILKQDKPVYLFDEPFNGLDLETNKVLELIIDGLKQKGKTIFVSSHILAPLLNTCDQIHLLEDGCFVNTYERASFHLIEADLFKGFTEKARVIVSGAL